MSFVGSSVNGRSIIDQLKEENVEMGWETYIVPFGRDTITFKLGNKVCLDLWRQQKGRGVKMSQVLSRKGLCLWLGFRST
jgi:hypothetical protein